MSNALKFTEPGGSVTFNVATNDRGDFVVKVIDTGIGIAEEDQARIFEPFVQVESAFSRLNEGTGLGLPLVSRIMALHGGTIELTSALGRGTCVTVTFPSSRVRPLSSHDKRAAV